MSEVSGNTILAILDGIAATASKNEKQVMVTMAAVHPDHGQEFQKVCYYAYNPFKIYGIKKIPATIGDHVGHDFDDGTWELLDDLVARRITGSLAIESVRGELTALSKESADLFVRILRKDLRAGFSEATINKAVKGLIPEFPYMRCSLPKHVKLDTWPWSRGVVSQEKADAMFINADHFADGTVAIRSRAGTEYPLDELGDLVREIRAALPAGSETHGELIVQRNGVNLPRAESNGVMNSIESGGKFEPGDIPTFLVWDNVPLGSVTPKGKCCAKYIERFTNLVLGLNKAATTVIFPVPTRIVYSLKEAYAHASELMKQGKEGTVIKHPDAIWKDGTSTEQVKLKLEFEVDLEIHAIVLGNEGTKNEGRAGSLACRTSCGGLLVDVTVKNDKIRDLIDKNPEDWVGRIIAVTANDITLPSASNPLHSLFLPRMSEAAYRTDKTVADSLQRVFDQKEAAILGETILKEAA